jgi:tetratricopeptide (TPR) repeat protein
LQSAQDAIIDDVYAVAVMVDIALGYANLNQTNVALTLLTVAEDRADAAPTFYRADTTPNLSTAEAAALLYEVFIKAYEKIGEKDLVHTTTVNFFLPWAQEIHAAGTVNDGLAGKECDTLLRAALYLEGAGEHAAALNALTAARESAGQIAVVATRLKKYLSVIATYAAVHEYEKALAMALSLEFTSERNQAIQTLANAYIDRDDFPESDVASIDSDGDGQPDFFHPLASAEEVDVSALLLDDDSDGDGIVDIIDLRPLFVD